MTIAADIDELYDVPDEADPMEFKQRVLADHAGAPGSPERDRRERFIEALAAWLGATLSGTLSAD
jgi:hypothetical protein